MKKILAFILCLVMVLSLASVTFAAEEKCVELTTATLGLTNSYDERTATVGGVTFGFVCVGDYGYGIQMKKENNGAIWTTTAFAGGITKIELTSSESKDTYNNTDAITFQFGNAADNLTSTVKLSTVKGTKSYTVTPDANTYTFLKIVNSNGYAMYFDSIKIYYTEEAGTVTPPTTGETEPPTEAPTEAPKPNVTATADVVEGTAYKFGMNQVTNGHHVFVTGEVSGRYLSVTTDVNEAADVYVEAVEGGYKFYILVDGVKNYITVYFNADNKVSVKYDPAGTTVYAYNAECNNWVTNLDGTDYYLGTYSNFDTVSASKTSFINAENTGVSQFPAEFYTVEKNVEGGDQGGNEDNAPTGDMITIVLATLAVSGMGIAAVAKKKEN